MLDNYARGLAAYREQRWDDALKVFASVLEAFPEDGAAKVMTARCRQARETPPQTDWDGVFEATRK